MKKSPKRIVFAGVQNKQTTHILNPTPMPVRTGYERVIGRRVDELYALYAEEDGVVESVTDKAISVKYKSGKVVNLEIGRRFGNWAGEVIPHEIVTNFTAGDKVKKDVVIAYNKNFFVPDTLDPTQVIHANSVLAKVVLVETGDTLEDSVAISEKFSEVMKSTGTTPRVIKVSFDQEVRGLLKEGTVVEFDSVLCAIENKTAGRSDLFDEKALETLKLISSLTPKAKAFGTVEKIEVFYAGDLEDMSESLRAIAEQSDRQIYKLRKSLGKKAVAGQVEPGFRVGGQAVENDTAIIRVYITGEIPMGIGDKSVVGAQLKCTTARVMEGINESESGQQIDVHFSYQSILNRVVNSPMFLGTTGVLSVHGSAAVVAAYEKS